MAKRAINSSPKKAAPTLAATKRGKPVVDVDAVSAASRTPARNQLAEDVEQFLARGGKIQEVPRNFRADPPRKPESNYGRSSI
jgi:hypothetical protein